MKKITQSIFFKDRKGMQKSEAGFTLIEMLVVVSIMSLLSSITMVSLVNARVKARDTRRKADIAQLQKALELYYNTNQRYPGTLGAGALSPNANWIVSNDNSWAVLENALKPFAAKLNKDPKQSVGGWVFDAGNFGFGYFSDNYGCDGQQYMLVYKLEDMTGVTSPGMIFCDNSSWNYGGTITTGARTR